MSSTSCPVRMAIAQEKLAPSPALKKGFMKKIKKLIPLKHEAEVLSL